MISVDAFSFLVFSDLTYHLEDTGIGVFSLHSAGLIVRRTKLGRNDQEASPSVGKNTGVVLVPCCAWKCVPTAMSGGVDISDVPGCHLLRQMSSQ